MRSKCVEYQVSFAIVYFVMYLRPSLTQLLKYLTRIIDKLLLSIVSKLKTIDARINGQKFLLELLLIMAIKTFLDYLSQI